MDEEKSKNQHELLAFLFFLGVLALSWPFAISLDERAFYFPFIFYFIVWLAVIIALAALSAEKNKDKNRDNYNDND